MAGKVHFSLGRKNYCLLLIAVLLIISGYFLMSGQGNRDGSVFYHDIYSFRRTTLAPVVLFAGYALIIISIMYRFKIPGK